MAVRELDTFVQKFKQLWYSGLTAHLDLDTHAGQAWVGLRARLGHAPGPLHIPSRIPSPRKTRDGPSRQRRRARRATSRQEEEAEEATQGNEMKSAENAEQNIENRTDRNEAEEALAEPAETAALELDIPAEEAAAEKASEMFACEMCDSKFNSLRAIRVHIGKKHKATGSPIPQIDGASSEIAEESVIYTFKSEYAEEDILYTIAEILSDKVETKLVSRVRLYGLRSADHLCTLWIKLPPDRNLSWPEMTRVQKEVIKDLIIEQKELHLFPA